jgi:tetratricopeptide (TPR) repeat protein
VTGDRRQLIESPAMRLAGRFAELALAAIVVAASADRAHADPQIDKAEQLFTEAKALMPSNLLQACGKFEESLRYNPAAIGTLLNVALCDEKLGRIASAVRKFSEARDHAKEQGLPEHLRAAEDHIAALAPSVPHLTINLTEALPDTKVLVDDQLVPRAELGDVAVDPGERVIVVSAPDRVSFRLPLTIAPGQHRAIFVPALSRSVTVTSSRRRIGQLTVAGGAVVLGTGIGFGLYARHLYQQEIDNKNCVRPGGGDPICSAVGKAGIENARNWGLGGTAVGIAGIAIAGFGAYLWYSAPGSARSDAADPKLTVVPEITGDRLGVVALGRF